MVLLIGFKVDFGLEGIGMRFERLAVRLSFPLFTLLVITAGMQKLPCFDVGNLGFNRLCKTSFVLCLRLNPFLSQ